jgi:hypothetical protein
MRASRFLVFPFGLMLAIGTVGAQAYERCEQVSVFSGTEDVLRHHVDHGPEGDSVGDRYVGHRPLFAKSGEVVGHEDWVFHVLHSMNEGETRIYGDWIMQFPTGEIFYKSAPTTTLRPLSGTGPLTPSDVPRIIIGGSGVFTGASGTIEYVRHDVGKREYVVKVSCK